MIKLIEPLNSIITRVVINEEGFASIDVVHPACDVETSYAFGTLELKNGKLKCDYCEETLLKWIVEDDDMPDATGL